MQKRYTDAIRWYDLALDYTSLGKIAADIWSNRAAALLNMGCYRAALKCTDRVFEIDPHHVKAIFRCVKSLLGLTRHQEAADFLERKFKENSNLKENQDLNTLRYFMKTTKMTSIHFVP